MAVKLCCRKLRLKRAIASVNGNDFRGGNDYQVSQWNDYDDLFQDSHLSLGNILNLNGEYAFNKDRNEIDLAVLLDDIGPINETDQLNIHLCKFYGQSDPYFSFRERRVSILTLLLLGFSYFMENFRLFYE